MLTIKILFFTRINLFIRYLLVNRLILITKWFIQIENVIICLNTMQNENDNRLTFIDIAHLVNICSSCYNNKMCKLELLM